MSKLVFIVICVIGGTIAEPPSSYLPPQARSRSSQQPSSQYGAPSTQYGAPRNGNNGNNGFGRSRVSAQPSQRYNAPSARFNQQPSQQYGAPSTRYGAPSNRFDDTVSVDAARFDQQPRFSPANVASSTRFSNGFGQQRQFNAPSQQYGAPRNGAQPSTQYGAPSTEYGAPRSSIMDDDLAEPANYEYNYEVQALDESGAEFGHQESREEDSARGVYHVLLPDGRVQIVEYEADEEGFRPIIRYEETGAYPDARNQGNQGPY